MLSLRLRVAFVTDSHRKRWENFNMLPRFLNTSCRIEMGRECSPNSLALSSRLTCHWPHSHSVSLAHLFRVSLFGFPPRCTLATQHTLSTIMCERKRAGMKASRVERTVRGQERGAECDIVSRCGRTAKQIKGVRDNSSTAIGPRGEPASD